MAKQATSSDLEQAFRHHLKKTEHQVERVERAFDDTGKAARAKTCEAMKGLIAEAEVMMEEDAEDSVKDAFLIACAQKIEHYEIATYRTLCAWAENLGYDNAHTLLKENSDEEEAADQKLTKLSRTINKRAMAVG